MGLSVKNKDAVAGNIVKGVGTSKQAGSANFEQIEDFLFEGLMLVHKELGKIARSYGVKLDRARTYQENNEIFVEAQKEMSKFFKSSVKKILMTSLQHQRADHPNGVVDSRELLKSLQLFYLSNPNIYQPKSFNCEKTIRLEIISMAGQLNMASKVKKLHGSMLKKTGSE